MPRFARPSAWMLVSLFINLCISAPIQAETAKTCVTDSCHGNLVKGLSVHSPAKEGDCEGCHEAVIGGTPFESGSNHRFSPVDVGSVCVNCHEAATGKKIHKPVADLKCTVCHNPHASAEPVLLKKPIDALCTGCHEKTISTPDKKPVVHLAIHTIKGCVNCHDPHASDRSALLRDESRKLCLGCHSRDYYLPNRVIPNIGAALSEKGAIVHDPVKEDCLTCHTPHTSERPRLLTSAYAAPWYGPPESSAYALCFDCHDSALVEKTDTSDGTGFRDGRRNLHSVHVLAKPRGRTCGSCHNVHASKEPHLLATEVSFFGLYVPINFKTTTNGGSCLPACHEMKSYDRTVGSAPTKP